MQKANKARRKINQEIAKLRTEHQGLPLRLSILNEKGEEVTAGTALIPADIEDFPGRYAVLVHTVDKAGKYDESSLLFRRELVIEDEDDAEDEEAGQVAPPADPVSGIVALMAEEMREMRAEMREMRLRTEQKQAEISGTLITMVTAAADERVKQSHDMHMEMMKLARSQVRLGVPAAAADDEEPEESPLVELGRLLLPVVKEQLPLILQAVASRGAKPQEAPE